MGKRLVLATVLAAGLTACGGGEPAVSVELLDLQDRTVDPFETAGAEALVFLFTRTDCPVSNRYAPEVRRLFAELEERGVRFWMVYPDPDTTVEAIQAHLDEYGYALGALRDPGHALVNMTGVTITPEAVVFSPDGKMVYRGRIDDRYVDFGKTRAQATRRDLQDALEAVLSGEPVRHPRTKAVGCFLSDLR